jgi:hypothetical protein
MRKKMLSNWPKVALVYLPLCLVAANVVALILEDSQEDPGKAIRLVREQPSIKENFTVQQYLYLTAYRRGDRVMGWNASQGGGPGSPVTVEFRFIEGGKLQAAIWEVYVKEEKIVPKNELARSICWNY